eukprot:TRINITY_DN33837_c0_g1_i1.p3 TRINITY_DN33837_c0_g1~~TRINITY_DN33837_c0_g1_i1.p3  ORF type:complete len:136 (-),score=34.35 TRINITY_DN33837_c0_g1_i1:36-443(-)
MPSAVAFRRICVVGETAMGAKPGDMGTTVCGDMGTLMCAGTAVVGEVAMPNDREATTVVGDARNGLEDDVTAGVTGDQQGSEPGHGDIAMGDATGELGTSPVGSSSAQAPAASTSFRLAAADDISTTLVGGALCL